MAVTDRTAFEWPSAVCVCTRGANLAGRDPDWLMTPLSNGTHGNGIHELGERLNDCSMKNYLVLNIAFSRGDVSHERTA